MTSNHRCAARPLTNAGTVHATPRYSTGGCTTIAQCRRIGVSPNPCTAGTSSRSNGEARSSPTVPTAAASPTVHPCSTQCRSSRGSRCTARAADVASIAAKSNSEPSMPPQRAAARYHHDSPIMVCSATKAKVRSVRSSAHSSRSTSTHRTIAGAAATSPVQPMERDRPDRTAPDEGAPGAPGAPGASSAPGAPSA